MMKTGKGGPYPSDSPKKTEDAPGSKLYWVVLGRALEAAKNNGEARRVWQHDRNGGTNPIPPDRQRPRSIQQHVVSDADMMFSHDHGHCGHRTGEMDDSSTSSRSGGGDRDFDPNNIDPENPIVHEDDMSQSNGNIQDKAKLPTMHFPAPRANWGRKSSTLFYIPVVLFVVTSILLGLGIDYHWFGTEKYNGIMEFCEHEHGGPIKQPANSISNIAFSIVGISIGWHASEKKGTGTNSNRFKTTLFYPLLLACTMVMLGAGSFALHATNTHWGSFLDFFGMFMLSSFVAAYALTRWFEAGIACFTVLYVGMLVGCCCFIELTTVESDTILGSISPTSSFFLFKLATGLLFELLLRYVRGINIDEKYGFASVAFAAVASILWNLSRGPDSVLCNPHLWLQGHALWHVLNAVSVWILYLFYASEMGPFNEEANSVVDEQRGRASKASVSLVANEEEAFSC